MSRRDRRARATGRQGLKSESFVMMPHILVEDPKFKNLSSGAHKMINYLVSQFKGYNNGDLDICEKNARRRGFLMSGASMRRGVKELLKKGFIELTRQGGRNRNSLFALAWFDVEYNPSKHDYKFGKKTMRWRVENS